MLKKSLRLLGGAVLVGCLLVPALAAAQECVVMITPTENAQVIGKRPEVKGSFRCPMATGSYVVMADGVDVTPLLDVTPEGFTYRPELMLAAGDHVLSVNYTGSDGAPQQFAVNFTIRHAQPFSEVYSKNDLSFVYEGAIYMEDSAQDAPPPLYTEGQTVVPSPTATIPRSKLEGNLASESKVKEGSWNVALTTNVRYFDQDIPAALPLKKGLTVANWLLTGGYEKERVKMKLSAGDVLINETQNTIYGFSRKGTVFNGEVGSFYANAFSAKSTQTYGVDGGIGIGDIHDDYLLGVSGGVKLFENKVDFRTIYVTGSDASSAGLSASLTPPSEQ